MIIIAIYLALINMVSLVFCGVDKFCARRRLWRIPEKTLLGLCAMGGAPLFWLGMRLFSHKTRHKRFALGVPVMAVIWILLVLAVVGISQGTILIP